MFTFKLFLRLDCFFYPAPSASGSCTLSTGDVKIQVSTSFNEKIDLGAAAVSGRSRFLTESYLYRAFLGKFGLFGIKRSNYMFFYLISLLQY